MTDLAATITPKSNQLNADDLIGGPRTITITGVRMTGDEQPIAIDYDGGDGRPYLPCKSMRRVLVAAWGPDGSTYTGRSMTIYRDAAVKFGGDQVGGIRISHLSHIDRDMALALTETRGKRRAFTVRRLEIAAKRKTVGAFLDELAADLSAASTPEEIDAITAREDVVKALGAFQGDHLERLNALVKAAIERVSGDDGFPGDRA